MLIGNRPKFPPGLTGLVVHDEMILNWCMTAERSRDCFYSIEIEGLVEKYEEQVRIINGDR